MASSRLEKLGTIFSRVTALLRTGVMKKTNKPIWYDIYQVFPPKISPSYDTIRPHVEIKPIFYPEDKIRAKFHAKMARRLPAEDLYKFSTSDITVRAINLTNEVLQKNESLTEDEALDKAIATLKQEGAFVVKIPQKKIRAKSKFVDDKTTETEKAESNMGDSIKTITDKNVDIINILKDK